jgi:hypothetical protein
MSFSSGYEAVLGYGVEASTATGYGISGTTVPSIPGTITPIGYATVPTKQTQRNSKKGFGLSSPYALYNGKGTRLYTINSEIVIPNGTLLNKLLPGSGGYKNLADLCIVTGNSNINSDGYSHAHRFCKCNTGNLVLQEGSAMELKAQVSWMGLLEQDGTTLNPTYSDLIAPGAPYFWDCLNSFTIGGNAYRDVLASLNINWNNNVRPRGFRGRLASYNSTLSYTHYALNPGTFVGRASLSYHERLGASLRKATDDATVWGNIVSTLVYGDKSLTVTLEDCLLDNDSVNGSDPNEAVMYGCDVLFKSMTVVAT